MFRLLPLVFAIVFATAGAAVADPAKIAPFDLDATPPVGTRLAYDTMIRAGDPGLRCRGIALYPAGAEKPVVLCAVDWIGISNGAQDEFRAALAEAAGTTPDRVAVHALHQHDAPMCDLTADAILRERGMGDALFDATFARDLIKRAAAAVAAGKAGAKPLTHVSFGVAEVEDIASNRRLLGDDGKVRAMRFTACKDPGLRAEPAGTIDPKLRLAAFWSGESPVAALTFYATHPQSYYRTGVANPDFPGLARAQRDAALPGVLHVHFTGAGGNIGAGKWNDGSVENRPRLAERLADGMAKAWAAAHAEKVAVGDGAIGWKAEALQLPMAPHLDKADAEARLAGESAAAMLGAAMELAWIRRCEAEQPVSVGCLRLGGARLLFLPGETFVEYQLAAQALRPDGFVATAGYGEYAMGYIGTEKAYAEGGYETSARASWVSPQVESVLLPAIGRLVGKAAQP